MRIQILQIVGFLKMLPLRVTNILKNEANFWSSTICNIFLRTEVFFKVVNLTFL